jgi:hypothetical protein
MILRWCENYLIARQLRKTKNESKTQKAKREKQNAKKVDQPSPEKAPFRKSHRWYVVVSITEGPSLQ